MTRTRTFLAVAVVALAAVACGLEAGGSGSGSAPRTIRIDAGDAGRTVTMRRADRLVVTLPRRSIKTHWILARYPKKELALESPRKQTGAYTFEARRAGRGPILVVDFLRGSDLLACNVRVGTRPPALCPVSGDVDVDSLPVRPGAFMVNVVVR